jgi:hypothetical protein
MSATSDVQAFGGTMCDIEVVSSDETGQEVE